MKWRFYIMNRGFIRMSIKHIVISHKLTINADDVLFIKACGQYVELCVLTESDKETRVENKIKRVVIKESEIHTITALGSIKNLAKKLPENFVKVNRYNIVNMGRVSKIEKLKPDTQNADEKSRVTFKGGFEKDLKGIFHIVSPNMIYLSKLKKQRKNGSTLPAHNRNTKRPPAGNRTQI